MNWLVVGLGNIGAEYVNTRHNMGFMVLDAWSEASGAVFVSDRYGSVAELSFRGHRITLLKPSTYMNLSGKAVRYWMQEKNVPIERVVVVCDDLNLPFGTVRMRSGGSDGGHNGLKNIQELTGSSGYPRIRLGIGNDFARGHQIDFVLGKLSDDELLLMKEISSRVREGIQIFVTQGIQRAMNSTNARIVPAVQQTSDAK